MNSQRFLVCFFTTPWELLYQDGTVHFLELGQGVVEQKNVEV